MKPLGFTYCEFDNETYFAVFQELLTEDLSKAEKRGLMKNKKNLVNVTKQLVEYLQWILCSPLSNVQGDIKES